MDSGQGYSYDAAGNTLTDANGQQFTYDGENKQTEVKNSSNATVGQYYYDGDGKRVKKYVPSTGETTIFVYDAAGKQIAEYSTVVESVEEAKVAYLTADHLGSPRINTDRDGNVISRHDYHPFGEEILTAQRASHDEYSPDTVRKQFTGYEKDNETELNFAETRYQNSTLGRFTSADDFANDSQISDPASWNKYVYVRNNPLKYVDGNGKKATITIVTDEEKKTVKIKIDVSIAFYAKDGISMEQLNEAAKKVADNIAKAWAGNFEKDGMSVTVDTAISWKTAATKKAAEALGFQNVIGFSDGDAAPEKDSFMGSGIFPGSPDRGILNINTVDNGIPAHEFGHLLGIDNRYSGNELMNTNLLLNPSNSTVATEQDFIWGFGDAIDDHRNQSRTRIPNPETIGGGLHNTQRGNPQSSTSTVLLRAGRIWWN